MPEDLTRVKNLSNGFIECLKNRQDANRSVKFKKGNGIQELRFSLYSVLIGEIVASSQTNARQLRADLGQL